MKRPSTCIGLLRGINLGSHNKVAMPALRALAEALGWQAVQTYLQSGNLVFTAAGAPAALEAQLEQAMERQFGLTIPVLVRTAEEWSAHAAGNPFPEAARDTPNYLLLALAKAPLLPGAAAALEARGASGERVAQVGEALWFYFPDGSGRSKLSPALINRLAGSPVTTRNWLTVLRLRELSATGAA